MKAVHKVIIGFLLLVLIGFIAMKTSSYMSGTPINTIGSGKGLQEILDLPTDTKCVPGSVPQGSYYSNSSSKGYCGIEKLITEELEYKFVDAPDAPLGE